MSISAKNALLKVTEEPPRQAYFIMTVDALSNTLPTLKSRGTVFKIRPYTRDNLTDYFFSEFNYVEDDMDKILDVCVVPGEVNKLMQMIGTDTLNSFFDYINLVVDNIGTSDGANVFKIGGKISFKKDDDLWDINMFLRAIRSACVSKLIDTHDIVYSKYVIETSKALSELSIRGIHKKSTFDLWILNMRSAWRCA